MYLFAYRNKQVILYSVIKMNYTFFFTNKNIIRDKLKSNKIQFCIIIVFIVLKPIKYIKQSSLINLYCS